jgi:hypothetical protein
MKYIFILLTCVVLKANAQVIIINGKEGNRPLTWQDFTAKPDASSSFYANTGWGIKFNTKVAKDGATGVYTSSVETQLYLDPKTSWVKLEKASDALLQHEQGHFNTGILCLRELNKKVAALNNKSSNFVSEVQSLFKTVLEKYKKMDLQYDEETNHSINKTEQQKWNLFYETELSKK